MGHCPKGYLTWAVHRGHTTLRSGLADYYVHLITTPPHAERVRRFDAMVSELDSLVGKDICAPCSAHSLLP
jgi:hypothetical protein